MRDGEFTGFEAEAEGGEDASAWRGMQTISTRRRNQEPGASLRFAECMAKLADFDTILTDFDQFRFHQQPVAA